MPRRLAPARLGQLIHLASFSNPVAAPEHFLRAIRTRLGKTLAASSVPFRVSNCDSLAVSARCRRGRTPVIDLAIPIVHNVRSRGRDAVPATWP